MIISDLCDEYAVLVSQNKAPVYGYDNIQKRFNKTNKSNEDNEQGENND